MKLFLEDGKLGTAAKHMKAIAEISEEDNKVTDALTAYQNAADYFEADGGYSRYKSNLISLKTRFLNVLIQGI